MAAAHIDVSKPREWQIRFEEAERRKDAVRRELYEWAMQHGGPRLVRHLMRRYGRLRSRHPEGT